METSTRAGLPLIKQSEGCRLRAYPDPGTGAEPFTIGWGRTTNVKRGDTCTQAQADAWLLEEYDRFEAGIRKLVKVHLSQNAIRALTCFAYNVGLANLASSTLLKRVNAGDMAGAAAEFSKWTKAAGKTLPGLVRRRAAEAALFVKVG